MTSAADQVRTCSVARSANRSVIPHWTSCWKTRAFESLSTQEPCETSQESVRRVAPQMRTSLSSSQRRLQANGAMPGAAGERVLATAAARNIELWEVRC